MNGNYRHNAPPLNNRETKNANHYFSSMELQERRKQSERRMTASVLNGFPNTGKVKKNAYLIWHSITREFSG